MPQIEVTFDMDANGILNVVAAEKSSGKSNKITITNDKGRLSKEDIERMVEEAEKFKEADLKTKENVEAKQKLESQIFQIKSELTTTYKDKISPEVQSQIETYIKQIEEWVDNNHHAEKVTYDDKIAELDTKFKEFVSKIQPGTTDSSVEEPGPQIEEID
jgi:molecular chaperone DnaK (HSP70)